MIAPTLSVQSVPAGTTAVLVLADGTVFWGRGFGAETISVGEVCFNTSMTGYQEILTDPSYAGQIITFTFPHIGNVGTNDDDTESKRPASLGAIISEDITEPSNFRATSSLNTWLKSHNLPAIAGLDTRQLTTTIRDSGAPHGVLCVNQQGTFDLPALLQMATTWVGLEGLDLAKDVTNTNNGPWQMGRWDMDALSYDKPDTVFKVVAIDYGAKNNILRSLVAVGCDVTVVPAQTSAQDILALNPHGVFLSNGPGDPAATGEYAVPVIRELINANVPIFGICLGHQMLALALGAKTQKMHLGHRGANHPIKDLTTGKVEITSQNHGFVVDKDSLPDHVQGTHFSLFDGTLAGLQIKNKPVFSVQYHPEASPGPQDSQYLFRRFADFMKQAS